MLTDIGKLPIFKDEKVILLTQLNELRRQVQIKVLHDIYMRLRRPFKGITETRQ